MKKTIHSKKLTFTKKTIINLNSENTNRLIGGGSERCATGPEVGCNTGSTENQCQQTIILTGKIPFTIRTR